MKFEGKPMRPPVKRRQVGGAMAMDPALGMASLGMPTNAVAQNAMDRIRGLSLGAPQVPAMPAQMAPPVSLSLETARNAATPAFSPTPRRGKNQMQEMLQSALMGGLAGFGGNAGIASALAMQAIPILAEALKKRSASPKKKGGGPIMKGKTAKPAKKMVKPAKKMAGGQMKKMAYGGKMKGKAC